MCFIHWHLEPNERTSLNPLLRDANSAATFLLTTKEPEYDILKELFNTQYGAYKIISFWYEFHHTSITLKEPLENVFADFLGRLKDPQLKQEERFLIEYSAYLIASTLVEVDDTDFKHLKSLLSETNPKNYFVMGLIESNFRYHYKKMSKDEKRRKEIRKLNQKVSYIDPEAIKDSVNIKLSNGQKIKSKPKLR